MLSWSATQTSVREATGRNDGAEVAAFLKVVGLPTGYEWCGAYQAYGNKHCGAPFPPAAGRAASWTPAANPRTYYIRGKRGSVDSLQPGHQVTFYYANLGRIGHVGRLVSRTRRGWYTNEGNTGRGGGRTGAGVHVLLRANWEFYAAANWLTK